LAEFSSISVAESLLKACEVFSRFAVEVLSAEIWIALMLPYADFFIVVEQHVILKECAQMTEQAFGPGFPAALPQLPMQMSTAPRSARSVRPVTESISCTFRPKRYRFSVDLSLSFLIVDNCFA
jgi:hypothetical protein